MITTEDKLRAALQRILEGKPRLIDTKRKLSVRAVEDEADVGKDTAYYYGGLIDEVKLRAALQRILDGKPRLIDTNRKFTISAIEEEAGVIEGTCYSYKDLITEIKDREQHTHNVIDLNSNILKRDKYLVLKEKYEKEKKKRKIAESINKKHASTLSKYQSTLNSTLLENQELHQQISELKDDLAKEKRKSITEINSQVK